MATKEPKDMLNDIADIMKDLEDAINTLESDSICGQIDEGSLRNIESAKRLSERISSLLTSMTKYIRQKVKEEENRYRVDFGNSKESHRDHGDYD